VYAALGPGLDSGVDFGLAVPQGFFQVVIVLQSEPEFGAIPKVQAEADCGICGDSAVAAQDF
jgi:sulfopyruvate decarboxylase TPP-binding subunit